MALVERDGHLRPLRIRVHHHTDNSVEAMIVLRGQDFKLARCPPLRAMLEHDAADAVVKFVIDINKLIQRALDKDASRGPTNAP